MASQKVSKWLPLEDSLTEEYLVKCRQLWKLSCSFESGLIQFLSDKADSFEHLTEIVEKIDTLQRAFITTTKHPCQKVKTNYQCVHWRITLNIGRLSLIYLLNESVSKLLDKYLDCQKLLNFLPRLVVFSESLFNLERHYDDNSVAIISNTCPVLYLPMKRLTLTRLLQIVAKQRAEDCAKELIAALMYINSNDSFKGESSEDEEYESSDSSMEVYRKLAVCLSPPADGLISKSLIGPVPLLEGLLARESRRLDTLFQVLARLLPSYLGPKGTRISNSTGEIKISTKARCQIVEYYQDILWSQVSSHLEHILIWKGIGYYGETCKNWKNWLIHFLAEGKAPVALKPALQNLKDGLTVHITSVIWDEMFRKALVSAQHHHSRQIVNNIGTETMTGRLFCDIFEELVELSNSCEGSNWTIEALEELPIVEQIPILHRLDHSIHTARLWAENRARKLASVWDMEQFFRVTQNDMKHCILALNRRMFANQVDLLGPECSVNVLVCGNMRAKLTSEVNENFKKLELVPKESIKILAEVCRTFSLANLKIIFPEAHYWKQQYDEIPQYASKYVEEYLETVLRPVLEATGMIETSVQQSTCCLVLDIMCEAWLHHIYTHRIKFSEWGALQLLADFGAVPTWLLERAKLPSGAKLLSTEALRRCEGVCRLLLAQPGHRIPTVDKTIRNYQDARVELYYYSLCGVSAGEAEGSPHRMPPEMYVPNQTQWLRLRADKSFNLALCCSPLFGSPG